MEHKEYDKREDVGVTKEKTTKKKTAMHVRNANSRTIFKNATLTCQFLKEYSDIPIFDNIEPEDIEDVSEIYQAFLGVEFESDTVKKVHVNVNGEAQDVYVVSLIEHKSYVDYDVAMQLLRYMTVIWHENRRKCEEADDGITSRKGFRYPLIIPIVYYEGAANWTADMHLRDRIACWEYARDMVPDFVYKVVRVHDYTNDELIEKNNEMSLAMLINKVQTPADYAEFVKESKEFFNQVYGGASGDIQEIYRTIIWALLMKMNVETKDAQKIVDEMEVGGMGYLFENMEKMDIQAERQNTKNAIKRAEEAERKAEEAERKAEEAERKAEEMKQKMEEMLEGLIVEVIASSRQKNLTREETAAKLQNEYFIAEEKVSIALEKYWLQ